MPSDTDGLPCKCGCGENLPLGSHRQFKRGHAKAFNQARAKGITAELKAKEGGNGIVSPPADDTFDGLGTNWDTIQDPFQSMAQDLPDDPEPDEKARDNASGIIQPDMPDGQVIVTKKVAQDIQGKLAFLISMPVAMLMPLDPVCFPVIQERIPEVTAKLVPLICQSPDMVKFFTKGTSFILWLNLAVTVWPIAQIVIAHHLTKSIGKDDNGNTVQKSFNDYAA